MYVHVAQVVEVRQEENVKRSGHAEIVEPHDGGPGRAKNQRKDIIEDLRRQYDAPQFAFHD